MPSLPASIDKYSPLDSFRNYLPKQPVAVANDYWHQSHLFAKFILQLSTVSTLLMLPMYICNYILLTDSNLYFNYYVYYISQAVRVTQWFLFFNFWISIQSGNYIYSLIPSIDLIYKHSHNKNNTILSQQTTIYPKIAILRALNIFILVCNLFFITSGSIAYRRIFIEDEDNDPLSQYFSILTKQWTIFCNIFDCNAWSLYETYRFVYGIWASLIVLLILNHCIFIMFQLIVAKCLCYGCYSCCCFQHSETRNEILKNNLKNTNFGYSRRAGDDGPQQEQEQQQHQQHQQYQQLLCDPSVESSVQTPSVQRNKKFTPYVSYDFDTGDDVTKQLADYNYNYNYKRNKNKINIQDKLESVDSDSNKNIGSYNVSHTLVYEANAWSITVKFLQFCIFYCVLFIIISTLMYCTLILQTELMEQHHSAYLIAYLTYLCAMTMLQFIILRVARQIDILRMQIPKSHFIFEQYSNNLLNTQFASLLFRRSLVNSIHATPISTVSSMRNNNNSSNNNNNNNRNKNKNNTDYVYLSHLSFEAMTRILVLLCYWLVYRILIVYSVPRLSSFILSKLLRILNLLFIVCIRVGSTTYWHMSDKFCEKTIQFCQLRIQKMERSNYCCYCCYCCYCFCLCKYILKLIQFCTKLFQTDSTVTQWQQRISIDLVCEFIVVFAASIIVVIELVSGKSKFYSGGYGDNWKTAVIYTIVSGTLETVYVPLIFVYYKYVVKVSLIEPFLRFYQFNGWTFVFYFSVLVAIASYLIPANALIDSAQG